MEFPDLLAQTSQFCHRRDARGPELMDDHGSRCICQLQRLGDFGSSGECGAEIRAHGIARADDVDLSANRQGRGAMCGASGRVAR